MSRYWAMFEDNTAYNILHSFMQSAAVISLPDAALGQSD